MTQKYIIYGKNVAWQIVMCMGKAVLFYKLKIKNSGMSALYYITCIYIYTHTPEISALEILHG